MLKTKEIFSPRNRSLVRELVISDFKLRYKNSILGYLWSLLKPLMLFTVLFFVFTRIVKVGNSLPYYPAYLLLGLVMWTFFVETTVSGMNSIIARGDMIRKVSIPKYTIVISTTMSALVNFALNMLVVFAFMLITDVPLRPTLLLAPILVIELTIFSLSIAFLLSSLYIKFRDISHIWEVLLQIMFYATPIIYDLSLPSAKIAKLISLNPLAQIFQDMRVLMISSNYTTTKEIFHSQIGRIIPMLIVVLLIVLGGWYFRSRSRNFAEEL